jgi:hypothetical protein
MKGKVTCTCGWSWNKSDSSAKDMYICHECGRDNSNNMKNGGWLDNYGEEENANDSSVSLPEGFVGEGYNTKGRDYSPAWGGQFQEGGEIPNAQTGKKVKYVKSKNDPRYKAYQDSLNLYNYGNRNKKYAGDYLNGKLGEAPSQLLHKLDDNTRNSFKDIAYHEQVENKFNKIKPIHKTNIYASAQGIKNNLIFTVPSWKKPQQQVIVKKQEKRKPIQAIENNLQPIGIKNDFNIEADVPQIRQQFTAPEYYDVEDIVNNGKSQTNYQWYPANGEALRELSEESGDRRTMVPRYQTGGTLPGSVGFTYARTKEIPSNGPYAKKTMPSAKNGRWLDGYNKAQDGKKLKLKDERDEALVKKDVTPDLKPKINKPLTAKQKEKIRLQKLIEKQGEIRSSTPQSISSRISEVVLNPLTAFGYAARNENLPENFSRGERNILDSVVDIVNPAFYIKQGAQAFENTGNAVSNTAQGNYPAAYRDIKNAGMNTLMALPLAAEYKTIGKGVKQLGRALGTEEGLLSNTYKYNPWAFKANPEAYYRMIGETGFDDAMSSGLIRSKKIGAYPEPYFAKGKIPDGEYSNPKSIAFNPQTGERIPSRGYPGPYMVQSKVPMKGVGAWADEIVPDVGTPSETVNAFDPRFKFYKQNWLQGYKEVPKPTSSVIDINNIQQQGFPNPLGIVDKVVPRPPYPGMIFGMEGSWNNLSPLNLIPGYGNKLSAASSHPNFVGFRKFGNSIQDVIESQSLRPRGSGMGSKQIMGEGNWAEPGKVNENYSGLFEATMNPQIKGSNIKLEKWNTRKGIVGTTKEGDVAIPLNDPGLSFNRRLPFSNRYVPIDKEKLINNQFQLSTQLPYVQSLAEKYGLWAGGAGAAGYIANGEKGARENINTINKYTIDPIIDYTKPKLKEANRQFQDLLNSTQRQNGGDIVKDDMGYWNPENWGSPVEIGSNNITMRDVPFDVLGISDTGDTKLMKPGKNYKFKGKKVTEFPMAKNGLRQEQKGLVNLDNLLNFTNYNKPQPGGWLSKYE